MQKREEQIERNGTQPGAGADFVPLSQIQASDSRLDIAAVREKLAHSRGRQYWKSLEEVADSDAFQAYLQKEFPQQAPRDMLPLGRREFFRLMGATLALAGVGGCAYQPREKIIPYVEQPEIIVPGKPLYYSTAATRSGYAIGVVGESHMGRPVKLEGNERHPASLGSTDAFTQAEILGLYDPDRSQSLRFLGGSSSWSDFVAAINSLKAPLQRTQGAGLRILTGTVTSPTLVAQLQRLKQRFPQARVVEYEPVSRENALAGAQMAFGRRVQPIYHFDRAQRIVSLDCNFLLEEPHSVRYARDFIKGRLVREQLNGGQAPSMNRLYVIESTPTITGAKADHALTVRPSRIEAVARALANALGVAGAGSATLPAEVPQAWLNALVQDLREHSGSSVVVAGSGQPPVVHALTHAINEALGGAGATVTYVEPVAPRLDAAGGTLQDLVNDIEGGRVEALFILGNNPVYTAPAEINLAGALATLSKQGSALRRGERRISAYLGLYDDETGIHCQWHIPESHFLEAWSDARSYDGTACIVQPLIRPLYDTRSAHELLSALLDVEYRSGYEIVREQWMGTNPAFSRAAGTTPAPGGVASIPAREATREFDRFWHRILTDGVIPNTAARPVTISAGAANFATPPAAAGQGMELVFRPDPTIWDGRYANNGWQQELPKPLTSLTWDNAALVSAATAEQLGVRNGDLLELAVDGRTLKAAAWILPGQPNDTVTLTLGYGRTRAGKVGNKTGFNAYALRTSATPGFATGVQVKKAGGSYQLVSAQQHFRMEGRDIVRMGTLAELQKDPKDPAFMKSHHAVHDATLYPPMWPSDELPLPESGTGGQGAAPHSEPHPEHEPGTPEKAEGEHATDKGPGHWESRFGRPYRPEGIPAWGMVIDQNACIGCNACTIACQAENNIATVGKDMVAMHRQMHWIRIDNYFTGPLDNPDTVFQPVPCQHCEKAPCEPVCPVEATSHSAEGINEMTYNRCIGTRYCSNNCPYKVRRFNFLQFSDQATPQIQLMRNPDVTVRSRGVMEKCTYCIQRINTARIEAEKEERPIRDGDVVVACAQACPTRAIVFGDINDRRSHGGKGSHVRQIKAGALNYGLLTELNTNPRTSYLPEMRNPNPAIPALPRIEHDGPFPPMGVGENGQPLGGHAPEATEGH